MSEQGLLRIKITDNWTVAEFAELLESLDYVYSHLNGFVRISDEFDQRIRSYVGDSRLMHKYPPFEFGYPRNLLVHSDVESLFEPLLAGARRAAGELSIKSVELHSPGWLELLGALPVLTLIGNFYIKYRQDETERKRIDANAQIEKTKSNVEQSKVDADVLKSLLEREQQLTRAEVGELMEQYIDLTREKPITKLKRLVTDSRIQEIEIGV